jgi:hypothetical protein
MASLAAHSQNQMHLETLLLIIRRVCIKTIDTMHLAKFFGKIKWQYESVINSKKM